MKETLSDPEIAGVYAIPEEGTDAVIAAATDNGHICYRANLGRVRSREQLLQTLGESLELPQWYGANFDALMDCLCDFSWVPAPGYTIILENCRTVRDLDAPAFNLMIDIFSEAATAWREEGKPFWCFVDLPPDA